MTARELTHLAPRGRRAAVLRATLDDFVSLSKIVRAVRAADPAKVQDLSIDHLRTREAVRDLRRAGALTKTPWGYRATAAGTALCQAADGARRSQP